MAQIISKLLNLPPCSLGCSLAERMSPERGKTSKSLRSVLDSMEVNDSPLDASLEPIV